MNSEHEDQLAAGPAEPVNAAILKGEGRLVGVQVTTADGRVFNLGRPESLLFKMRLRKYLRARDKEIKHG